MSVVDFEYGLDSLRGGVSRVVFVKKGNGNVREMWATRNHGLISDRIGLSGASSMKESREELEKQRNNGNLVVFDLENNAFRTIPLSNIMNVDPAGLPGWINFDLDEDWENFMFDAQNGDYSSMSSYLGY